MSMKILLMNDYSFMLAGAERYVIDFKKLLERNGYEVKILGSRKKSTYSSLISRTFSLKWYLKTVENIKSFKPDIFHINSLSWVISPSPLIAAKRFGIPTVCTVHNFHYICPKSWMLNENQEICKYGYSKKCLFSKCFPKSKKIFDLLNYFKVGIHRIILRKYVDVFICPSKILTDWMQINFRKKGVVHIPNFVDIKKRHGNEKSSNGYLLYVGRLSKEKGIHYLIKAIEKVIQDFPNVKLKVVGHGPEKENLEKLAVDMGIENNIDFLGFVTDQELKTFFENCYAVVMPSFWMENNPIVGLESLAYKKPLIGSNIGGIPEIIIDGKTGYLFRPEDYEDLSEKIMDLLSNPERGEKFGRNAKKLYDNEFTPTIHINKLEDLYNKLISKNTKIIRN